MILTHFMVLEISSSDLVLSPTKSSVCCTLLPLLKGAEKYKHSSAYAGELQILSAWIPEILVVVSVLCGMSHHGVAQALCESMEESGEGSSPEVLAAFTVITVKHTRLE